MQGGLVLLLDHCEVFRQDAQTLAGPQGIGRRELDPARPGVARQPALQQAERPVGGRTIGGKVQHLADLFGRLGRLAPRPGLDHRQGAGQAERREADVSRPFPQTSVGLPGELVVALQDGR